jgi:hypothetical protein
MKKRKKINFKITAAGTSKTEQEPRFSLPQLARLAMQAEHHLVPLIQAEKMDPTEALTLIVMHTHYLLMDRKPLPLSEHTIYSFSAAILTSWKYRLFTPSDHFPYTFDQMFEAWGGELLDVRLFRQPGAPLPPSIGESEVPMDK